MHATLLSMHVLWLREHNRDQSYKHFTAVIYSTIATTCVHIHATVLAHFAVAVDNVRKSCRALTLEPSVI
jgi:hypothetical protein